MKTLLLIITALALSGCATHPDTERAMLAAHAAQEARPTLSLKCPAGGCEFSYTDPRDRQQIKLPTNGWDALVSIGHNVTSVVPILVTGRVALGGFEALKNSGGVQTSTTTNTTTGAVTTSTVGDNSGANASNSGRIAGSTMTDATGTPTVVTQPAPLVVTQPAPIVVTQPAPLVMQPVLVPGAM